MLSVEPAAPLPRSQTTGLVSDGRMCNHVCTSLQSISPEDTTDECDSSDSDHPECPERIICIMNFLEQSGLKEQCAEVPSREVLSLSALLFII